jgi:hypothetical protein
MIGKLFLWMDVRVDIFCLGQVDLSLDDVVKADKATKGRGGGRGGGGGGAMRGRGGGNRGKSSTKAMLPHACALQPRYDESWHGLSGVPAAAAYRVQS